MAVSKPIRWSEDQFDEHLTEAIDQFRQVRMQEPLEEYLEQFDQVRDAVDTVIEGTVDLKGVHDQAQELLKDPEQLVVIRYLASPAISEDDLKVLADAKFSRAQIDADAAMVKRVIDTVWLGLDRNRFPWVSEDREPTEAERQAAVISTAALIASQKVQTRRRNTAKDEQEERVAEALRSTGFTEVPTRAITNLSLAPTAGEYCHESLFGTRKADLVVGLWDGRAMPLECKVSNSSTNSVKRLNNDAAVKAKTWLAEFGSSNCVPAAVLSGVFKRHNLIAAQSDGLALYWAHRLDALLAFIDTTKP